MGIIIQRMKLKLVNRLTVLNNLPTKGSFDKLILAEDIKKKLTFSQDEIKEMDVKTLEDGRITWNSDKDVEKEIDFSSAETEMIKSIFLEQSNNNELSVTSLETYKMFKNYESK